MKPKVLVSVPTQGTMNVNMFSPLLEMTRDPRCKVQIAFPNYKPYVWSLHNMVNETLKQDFDYLINIDEDNPPLANVMDLIFLDKDVIGCPTPVWKNENLKYGYPVMYNVYTKSPEVDAYDAVIPMPDERGMVCGLYEADVVGTGCVVIARHVLETIKAPFMREWNEDGTIAMGNDMAFCRRVKKHGFKVWAHFDYACSHYKTVNLYDALTWVNTRLAEQRSSAKESSCIGVENDGKSLYSTI
jgi:hypothetical protein